MEFYEGPDGIGRAVNKSTYLGTTYVDLVGEGFRGSYPLSTLALLEDHSEELLSKLPSKGQGARLPYDPRPRYQNPGEATIEPDHKLPANLTPTNSLQNITHPDSDIMDVFPTDTHRYVTPYHASAFSAALYSLGDVDAEVNPEEHNHELQPIEVNPDFSAEDHSTHTPFTDDPFMDGRFDGEMSDPTSEEWGVPAVQQFPSHGASTDFRGGRPEPRLHFQADLPGDDVEEGEFVEDSGEGAEGTFSDKNAAWEYQSPNWDKLPSSSTLDEPFSSNNWDDRKMAPGNPQESGTQVDPKDPENSNGTEQGEDHDESTEGPWEELEPTKSLDEAEKRAASFDFLSEYKYVKPMGNGKYKIVQKGTGKTLSEHDSKEDAEAAFRAMEMNMHGGAVRQTPQGWFYIGPGGHQEGPFPTPAGAETAEKAAESAEENRKLPEGAPGGGMIASFDEEEIPRHWKQYFAFLDNDRDAREAAWADVRTKGLRLAREGNVHVDKYTSFQTDATVQGDSGTYTVTVYRTAGWAKGVAHYTCDCEWGKWAWRRHFYYGRFCSHGYATYLESQKLDKRRHTGPLDDNVSVGLLATTGAAWDNWNNGDQVRLTDHHNATEVDGNHVIAVIPGDTGEIISIPYQDSAEVRMHHGDFDDLNIPFDKLEKIGFAVTAFEEHDESEGAGASEAFRTPEAPDTGDPGIPDKAKDLYGDDSDDVTGFANGASFHVSREKTTLDPDQWDPQHDKDIHVFSEDGEDDLQGKEVPHVPEGDHLRSMTKFDDPRFGDATDNDEMDNASLDSQISSPETMAGGEDFGNVQQSDQQQQQTASNYHNAALDWLYEDNSGGGNGVFDGVDPILAAKLTGQNGQSKIQKSSAKVYSPMEQLALVEEEGRSDLVDHLNLTNSFYES